MEITLKDFAIEIEHITDDDHTWIVEATDENGNPVTIRVPNLTLSDIQCLGKQFTACCGAHDSEAIPGICAHESE